MLDDTLGLAPFEPAPAFGRTPMEFTGSPGEETHDSLWRQCDTIEDCADDPPVEQPDAFLKALDHALGRP